MSEFEPGIEPEIDQEIEPESKRDRVYAAISKMYQEVMFAGDESIEWTGYSSGVGFPVEGLGFYEPSLQRLLSLLHLKYMDPSVSDESFLGLVEASVEALENFDPEKDVNSQSRDVFLASGAYTQIMKVAQALKQALS